MTALLIGAQDIRAIDMALVRDHAVINMTSRAASPEQYLATLARVLEEWGVSPSSLNAVGVVSGPGSFTSSRVSTLIANAFAFAHGLPVVGVENARREPLEAVAAQVDWSQAGLDRFVLPVYDRPAHITLPRNGSAC